MQADTPYPLTNAAYFGDITHEIPLPDLFISSETSLEGLRLMKFNNHLSNFKLTHLNS